MKTADLSPLQRLIARLRGPDGCPWDREQTLSDLRAYLVEEAHEVAAAIDEGDLDALADELGDLLFQVVFVAELSAEGGGSDLAVAISRIHAKMVARHPHVFGEERLADARAVAERWQRAKLEADRSRSLLAGVPRSLPALTAAYRMTQKAAGVGFDWPAVDGVVAKVREELDELERAISAGADAAIREELGDVLFSAANLARHLGIDPEAALAGGNAKFRRRFMAVEKAVRDDGGELADTGLDRLESHWQAAKLAERHEDGSQ